MENIIEKILDFRMGKPTVSVMPLRGTGGLDTARPKGLDTAAPVDPVGRNEITSFYWSQFESTPTARLPQASPRTSDEHRKRANIKSPLHAKRMHRPGGRKRYPPIGS